MTRVYVPHTRTRCAIEWMKANPDSVVLIGWILIVGVLSALAASGQLSIPA